VRVRGVFEFFAMDRSMDRVVFVLLATA
jgi:hypothetical protein